MKVVKQRNPYLKRVASDTPHKYSYDMQSGKFLLLYENGAETLINKTGTFNPKFRKKLTGFASHKQRYSASQIDHTALHFIPDLSHNSYCTPMTRKFMGYAQQPYKIRGRPPPQFLSKPQEPHEFIKSSKMKKSQSENKQLTKQKKNISLILEHSAKTLRNERNTDQYFQTSFMNMTESKPLPKFVKKNCYNYRCRYLKHFMHDKKGITQFSTRFSNNKSSNDNTLSKSFYEKQFDTQRKELSCLQSQLT